MWERALGWWSRCSVLYVQGVVVKPGGQDYPSDRATRWVGRGSKVFGVAQVLVPPTELSTGGGAGLTTGKTLL